MCQKKSMTLGCNIWMICLKLSWLLYDTIFANTPFKLQDKFEISLRIKKAQQLNSPFFWSPAVSKWKNNKLAKKTKNK